MRTTAFLSAVLAASASTSFFDYEADASDDQMMEAYLDSELGYGINTDAMTLQGYGSRVVDITIGGDHAAFMGGSSGYSFVGSAFVAGPDGFVIPGSSSEFGEGSTIYNNIYIDTEGSDPFGAGSTIYNNIYIDTEGSEPFGEGSTIYNNIYIDTEGSAPFDGSGAGLDFFIDDSSSGFDSGSGSGSLSGAYFGEGSGFEITFEPDHSANFGEGSGMGFDIDPNMSFDSTGSGAAFVGSGIYLEVPMVEGGLIFGGSGDAFTGSGAFITSAP